MAEELLSLKWNNHQTHFVDILSILREHEIFIDVTIACGGKLYAAHKFVLSTCSDYFKQMFINTPAKHPIIFMKDVSSRDIEALMDFMYNGEVNVPQSTLGSLIKTAESLQIKGLAVPDDAPARKERETNNVIKRKLDPTSSPPSKRLKPRELNHNFSSILAATPNRPKSQSPSRPIDIVTATIDDDSDSVHSGTSEISAELKPDSKNMNENLNYLEKLSANSLEDPLAGPSGLQKSKVEPASDIKRENISSEMDIVDEEDEYDSNTWNQECDSRGEEDRGEVLINSDNSNLFTDNILPGNDGSSLSVSTDSAMFEDRPAYNWRAAEEARPPLPVYHIQSERLPPKQIELRDRVDQLDAEIVALMMECQSRNVERELYAKQSLRETLRKRLRKLVYWQMRKRRLREEAKRIQRDYDPLC